MLGMPPCHRQVGGALHRVRHLGHRRRGHPFASVADGGSRSASASANPAARAVPLSSIEPDLTRHRSTGVDELDRVFGGGVVPGSVTLLAGDPGVGKSTLLLKVAHRWAQTGHRALYISGEESTGQIRLRADRIGCALTTSTWRRCPTCTPCWTTSTTVQAGLVIVDSVQTMCTTDAEGVAGGVTQVRAVTAALTAAAKSNGTPLILVGHVTKDGAIAGPRSLEHLVDVVLHFEGDRNGTLRMVRGIKNRFGAADEVGCFKLHDNGIEAVADPSNLFLDQRPAPVPGTAITGVTGRQTPTARRGPGAAGDARPAGHPRRAVSGIDHARAAMITAVLEKHAKLNVGDQRHLPVHGRRHATDRPILRPRGRDRAGFRIREPAVAHHGGDDRRGGAGRGSAPGRRDGPAAGRSRTAGIHRRAGPTGLRARCRAACGR